MDDGGTEEVSDEQVRSVGCAGQFPRYSEPSGVVSVSCLEVDDQ